MDVVVVESPAKARTLRKVLGRSYRVLATGGHVSDLPAKAGSVKPGEGFATVTEISGRRAARALGAIRSALARAGRLILATDPDREGEAIAWQVLSWLREVDALGDVAVHRVAFHEVTPAAVDAALARPRDIDMDLVRAQQARRALDYLVGYGLSPVLWRKLPGCRSAGRVQSVALRLLCDREAGIEAFEPQRYWTVVAELETADGTAFPARLRRLDGSVVGEDGLAAARLAEDAAERIRAAPLAVLASGREMLTRRPPPPFTTASLQQEAARRLGLSVAETMEAARRLYEGVDLGGETVGLITYMRTASAAMAPSALGQARAEIRRRFGEVYLPAKPRAFRDPARSGETPRPAREAHEAIRPTDFARAPEALESRPERGPGRGVGRAGARGIDRAAAALYALVWKRTMASQMAPARFERLRVEIALQAGDAAGGPVLEAVGEAPTFDGHLRVWDGAPGAGGGPPPGLGPGDGVRARAVRAERQVTEPPARYTEAGLVRRLDELGIGRPSTWAAILAVLPERGYAVLHDRRFVPTERGRVATAFLEGFFATWMDYRFTARMEADLDRVAGGGLAWKTMLEDFWGGFHGALEDAGALQRAAVRAVLEERLGRYLFPDGPAPRRCPACGRDSLELKLSRHGPFVGCGDFPACDYRRNLPAAEARDGAHAGPRGLGSDPDTGLEVTLRRGPNGWYVQRGEAAGRAKLQRVSLPPPVAPAAVDLDLALRLLALPREVGPHPGTGKPIQAGIGRYGPWLHHDDAYTAVPGDEDVLTVGLNRAVALIEDKRVRDSRARGPSRVLRKLGRHPGDGAPVWLKTGHYGPFVAHRRRYAGVPEDIVPDTLTLEQAVGLLDP